MVDAKNRRKFGYGKSVDLWALGVLIYEMLLGESPFVADNQPEIYKKVCGHVFGHVRGQLVMFVADSQSEIYKKVRGHVYDESC